jgi:hypothetical protein
MGILSLDQVRMMFKKTFPSPDRSGCTKRTGAWEGVKNGDFKFKPDADDVKKNLPKSR